MAKTRKMIIFREDQYEAVRDIFDVVIPNDYRVFVDDYRFYGKGAYMSPHVEVDMEQKEWVKMKRIYFKGAKSYHIPGLIDLREC